MTTPDAVVVGAGLMGLATTYYLALRGVKHIVVVERSASIAPAASGKAGGFLAKNWCRGQPTEELARRSFEMHEEFADQVGRAVIDYRHLQAVTCEVAAKGGSPSSAAAWLSGPRAGEVAVIGSKDTCAQVTPLLLCEQFLTRARAVARIDCLMGVGVVELLPEGSDIVGVRLADGRAVRAGITVLCLGAWAAEATAWLDGAIPNRFGGLKVHSTVLRPAANAKGEMDSAVFIEGLQHDRRHRATAPEIYPRGGGEVYVCGIADEAAEPPEGTSDVTVSYSTAGAELRALAASLAPGLVDAPVLAEQACFVPFSPDGAPLIGRVPRHGRCYIACGHGCWGVLLSHATGRALAELITGATPFIDLSVFDPARFIAARSVGDTKKGKKPTNNTRCS